MGIPGRLDTLLAKGLDVNDHSVVKCGNCNDDDDKCLLTTYPWVRGWCSGESTCLPPMWPGFDSQSRRRLWVEFVVGSRLCYEGFSPGTPVFLPPQKPMLKSKFQFDLETVDGRATPWNPLKFPFFFSSTMWLFVCKDLNTISYVLKKLELNEYNILEK